MSRQKSADEDYEEMARDYAEYPVTADEVIGEIEYRDGPISSRIEWELERTEIRRWGGRG